MEKEKKVNWKSTLLISIFLGYLGIDSFILKKPKQAIKKIVFLILSGLIIFNFERIIEIITNVTGYVLYYTKTAMSHLGNGQFLLVHIPRLIGLAVLTILVIIVLFCSITIIILWLRGIISIARKDYFEGIEWSN